MTLKSFDAEGKELESIDLSARLEYACTRAVADRGLSGPLALVMQPFLESQAKPLMEAYLTEEAALASQAIRAQKDRIDADMAAAAALPAEMKPGKIEPSPVEPVERGKIK